MPNRSRSVRVTIYFDPADYRIFVRAAHQLRRIMGNEAPAVTALIRFNLQDRDVTGLADDYLDAIRWPSPAGRVVSLKPRITPARPARSSPRAARRTSRLPSMSTRITADSSRN